MDEGLLDHALVDRHGVDDVTRVGRVGDGPGARRGVVGDRVATVGVLDGLRRHPEVGARVAAHLSLGKQEAEFIHFHHENFDGTGYPMGLAGQAIPQGARILAVAEAYNCMVSSERRQGRLTPTAALAELEDAQGRQFDPSVVAAFKSVLLKRAAA